MKIRKLQLKNIGVFDDEIIEFKPCPVKDKAEIHILTGQNGSGKSTILMAIASSFDYFEKKSGGFSYKDSKLLSNNFHKRFNFSDNRLPSFEVTKEIKVSDGIIEEKTVVFGDNITKLAHNNGNPQNAFYNLWVRSDEMLLPPQFAGFSYAVFVYSGYGRLNNERIEAIYEPKNFNPLYQSLELIKDYGRNKQITINQLIVNNISKSAIEKGRNDEKSRKFSNVINSIAKIISAITDWTVEFNLETEPLSLIAKINGEELDFDVLPDGLSSLINWIADLLGRTDLIKWQDDLSIFEKNLVILLDEIEVHLHPAWQRKVLPVVQQLFKNSQIFVSTHSPFVVNSVDDAWVYKLKLDNGKAKVESVERSEDGNSYSYVLEETFDIKEEFGVGVQKELDEFYKLRNSILSNGSSKKDISKITKLAKEIAEQSEELNTIIQIEIRQINRKKELDLKI